MPFVNRILDTIRENHFTDLLVEGFIDETELPLRFHAMLSHWYLKFEDVCLRCALIGQADRLSIGFVDRVALSFDMDEDDKFGVSSVYEMCLPYTGPSHTNYVTSLKLIAENEVYLENGILRCAEFQLGILGTIFMEPTIYGIHFGQERDRDKWMQSNGATNPGFEWSWSRDNQ
jgi:hypothetical protein